MKKSITVLVFVFFAAVSYGQDDYRYGIFYGYGHGINPDNDGRIGDSEHTLSSFGLKYQKRISNIGYFTTGINYTAANLSIKGGRKFGVGGVTDVPDFEGKQHLLGLSLGYKSIHFNDIVYTSGELLFDFALSKIDNFYYQNQSGLGLALGTGLDIPISSFVLSVGPKFRLRSGVDFGSCEACEENTAFGVKSILIEVYGEIGLAYKIF